MNPGPWIHPAAKTYTSLSLFYSIKSVKMGETLYFRLQGILVAFNHYMSRADVKPG